MISLMKIIIIDMKKTLMIMLIIIIKDDDNDNANSVLSMMVIVLTFDTTGVNRFECDGMISIRDERGLVLHLSVDGQGSAV